MKLTDRIRIATQAFRGSATSKNSLTVRPSNRFLRFGNNQTVIPNWATTVLDDEDLYTGYPYGVVNRRARAVASLGTNNLFTDVDADDVVHPYLKLIDESPSFTNFDFFNEISIYLDLEGVYYLFVLRHQENGRMGNALEFKLLNPYQIERVINKETKKLGAYIETNEHNQKRVIQPHMIIEIRELNPFNKQEPYAMTDAARDSQFILKQGTDYTRSALAGNTNTPALISTDVELAEPEFNNFVARIKGSQKGEPIFGNGAGAITWQDTQTDLNKAALTNVADINIQQLIAVSGTSKTILGIEQSGTTRDTAKVQKDLFTEFEIIPRMERIIGALNQDYKNNYKDTYAKQAINIRIDSPLKTDYERETQANTARQASFKLYADMRAAGYDHEDASKFAEGELTLEELSDIELTVPQSGLLLNKANTEETNEHVHVQKPVKAITNALELGDQQLLASQQSSLENTIANIEGRLISQMIIKVGKQTNAFEKESEVVTKTAKNEAERELEAALIIFYGVMINLYAKATLTARAAEFGMSTVFNLNSEIRAYIKQNAKKASASHVSTIVDDILSEVRKLSLDGKSIAEITSKLTADYDNITKTRARTIARTETNRAFTTSQYEADKQFLKQNELEGRAYKKWITRSGNPCEFCEAKSQEAPIPFDRAFNDLGDELSYTYEKRDGTTGVKTLSLDYETIEAGNLHVNCSCVYQLIIR